MIEIKCDTKDTLQIEDLQEFQGELKARTDSDVQKIIRSIKKHGFSFPFFVWNHDGINHVFDGHGRLMALKLLQRSGEEIPALPVVYVQAKDEADAKELLLKLNSQYGKMTEDSVKEFLAGIEIDPNDLALPDGILDLNFEPEETTDDDEIPEVDDSPAQSERGQVYQLGPHRLMCGDSTSEEDVAKLMDGIKADLTVTDPPYNVALGMGGSFDEARKRHRRTDGLVIMNDKMSDSAFYEFLVKVYTQIKNFTKNGGAFYIWHADSEGLNFRKALQEAGLTLRQNLIWVKNTITLGRQDYQWKHEPCLYGWIDGAAHYWEGRRDLPTVYDEKPDYKKMDKPQLLAEIEKLRGDNKPASVIYEDKPARSEDHPTMKPVRLFQRLIENSSKEEDVVFDPFGGSGTTIIAAAKINRRGFCMELDPKYCDVIRRRWYKWAEENGEEPGPDALEPLEDSTN